MDGESGRGFEEYEWAGQKRIRATALLEGGFRGINAHQCESPFTAGRLLKEAACCHVWSSLCGDGVGRDVCFLLINHSLSANMVGFNFFASAHESAQGAVMVPVVWGQPGPEPPQSSPGKGRKTHLAGQLTQRSPLCVCSCVFVSRNAIIEVDRRAGHWGTCLQQLCHNYISSSPFTFSSVLYCIPQTFFPRVSSLLIKCSRAPHWPVVMAPEVFLT